MERGPEEALHLEATVEPSTVVAGSGTEKRKRLEGALGDQSLGSNG